MSCDPPTRHESVAKRLARQALGSIPIGIGITGPLRDRLLRGLDIAFGYRASTSTLESIETRDGRRFVIFIDSANQRLLSYCYHNLLRHYRRSPLFEALSATAPEHGGQNAFLDVGANLGIYSLLAGELGYRSIPVEPEPEHADFLARHPEYFGAPLQVAVGDSAKDTDLFVANRHNPGASSLVLEGDKLANSSIYDRQVSVSVVRLDDLLEHSPIEAPSVRFIKIDVEGHEAAAIRGLRGFLDDGHRPWIWCEVRGPQSGRNPSSYRDVIDGLQPYGYEVRCGRSGFPQFKPDHIQQVFDLLFVPCR